MAIKHSDFLAFAQALSADCEINLRNSISRAYYAAYHACLQIYKMDNAVDGGLHTKLIQGLKKSSAPADRQIGYMLEQLKNQRVIADYKLLDNVSIKDKDSVLSQTEKLLTLLSTLPAKT